MTWFKWQEGRQGTGYRKLLLASGKNWDAYIVDYPSGTFIKAHKDPVEGKRHYRLNILLWGEDAFGGESLFKLPRIVFFRPDIMMHSVRKVSKRRLVLSFGVAVDA